MIVLWNVNIGNMLTTWCQLSVKIVSTLSKIVNNCQKISTFSNIASPSAYIMSIFDIFAGKNIFSYQTCLIIRAGRVYGQVNIWGGSEHSEQATWKALMSKKVEPFTADCYKWLHYRYHQLRRARQVILCEADPRCQPESNNRLSLTNWNIFQSHGQTTQANCWIFQTRTKKTYSCDNHHGILGSMGKVLMVWKNSISAKLCLFFFSVLPHHVLVWKNPLSAENVLLFPLSYPSVLFGVLFVEEVRVVRVLSHKRQPEVMGGQTLRGQFRPK